ncbi:MAG: hypothetical protein AAGF50_05880 [Pseudomonadota bacterium]
MTQRQTKIAALYLEEIAAEIESLAAILSAVRARGYDPENSMPRREDVILADLCGLERRFDNLAKLSSDAAADVVRTRAPHLRLVSDL